MIELHKSDKPDWITLNQHQKTMEYKAASDKSKLSPWREIEVVERLKQECSKKCMYCECFIDDASYSAVEHIRPKKHFEDLVLEWTNLGLACWRCNTNKGDYWTEDSSLQLLNPYQDSLSEHVYFHGPLTVARLRSSRGINTVRQLKLKRDDLMLSRLKRIEEFEKNLKLWHDESDAERKQLYAEDVSEAIGPDREFSGLLRAYAIQAGFPLDSDDLTTKADQQADVEASQGLS
ncbi:HNH endonuclease [Arthrobacter sp. 31Y]|uniref:HNH endonuclease n=1 Tax=Arthrobacter sp. 31Y TaxID=1115632 RepID=UPI000467B0DA|nr:HNH endonuclease [Arthrobacter sp. 31Y]